MWKPGPLPENTYGWGGVVLDGFARHTFMFADFCGDHVKLPCDNNRVVRAEDVVQYDNGIWLPDWPRSGESFGAAPTEGGRV